MKSNSDHQTTASRQASNSSGPILIIIIILLALTPMAVWLLSTQDDRNEFVRQPEPVVAASPTSSEISSETVKVSGIIDLTGGNARIGKPVSYRLTEAGQVSAAVYDSEGRMVRTLLYGQKQEAGEHKVVWDGLDRDGTPLKPGRYNIRLLKTPGFTAQYVTALGINPGIEITDPAYNRTGRIWAGSHAGVSALAVDDEGIYVAAASAEFVPIALKQSFDGTRRFWERQEFQAAQGAIAMTMAYGRLIFLQANGQAMLVNPATGARTGQWDLKHEDVPRDPSRYYNTGEKVYNASTIDIAGRGETLVVSHNRQNLLRWIDSEGATAGEVEVPSPCGIFIDHNDRLLVISEGTILAVTPDGERQTVIDGLTAPLRLTVEQGTGDILIVEGAPLHQVRRFSASGDLLRIYGREGGRLDGPYVPTDFRGVTALASDPEGNFFVAEPSGAPRRVARFDRDGQVLNEWYGPTGFFTSASPDPQDPTKVWYTPQDGHLVLAQVDYKAGEWSVLETHLVGGLANGLFPGSLGSYHSPPFVRYHDGNRYLVFGTSPPNVALHVNGKLHPVVAGARGGAQLNRAREIAGYEGQAAGFLWHDLNRDGEVQADELEFFQHGMHVSPKMQAPVGQGFDLLGSSTRDTQEGSLLSILRLPATRWAEGVPIYPTSWDTITELLLPHRTHFAGFGFLETDDGFYAVLGCSRDQHGTSFPTDRMGKVRVAKFDNDGDLLWSTGVAATRDPHNLVNPSPPGQFHELTGFVGHVRGTVVVCDRSVYPATAWTEDGLYAGYFLDHRADDGLPESLYHWWCTVGGVDTILNFDHEIPGRIVEYEGEVYWLSNGWQCVPIYRITGWDGWQRQEIAVGITEEQIAAKGEGTGLQASYYGNIDFEGEPAIERTDRQVWFLQRGWYGMETEVWNNGPRGLDRKTDFSVRWVGEIEAPFTEDFVFSVYANARVRLWVDGQQLIYGWNENATMRVSPPVALEAGKRYPIRLDFSTAASQPTASLNWESFSIDRQRIPQMYLYPEGDGGDVQVPQPRPATSRIDPTTFFTSEGHVDARGILQLGNPSDGMVGYQRIDFGEGVTRMHAAANTWSGIPGPTLVEVRVGGPEGTLLGVLEVPASNNLETIAMDVEQAVTGVHDLYLINICDARNQWARIGWFRFE